MSGDAVVVELPVHPRVRGEHYGVVRRMILEAGSSPRARGTPVPPGCAPRTDRFIPACAGNTRRTSAGLSWSSVHPRVRGEHDSLRRGIPGLTGSSPRARGTRGTHPPLLVGVRFIPACAGNTACSICAYTDRSVHPRVRGEHNEYADGRTYEDGSSPRARGTHAPSAACRSRGAVNPRVRGEHAHVPSPRSTLVGSSPRARGTLRQGEGGRQRGRFIPACAGNTARARARTTPPPVHPRVRGEHKRYLDEMPGVSGSSPRARGTPGRSQRHGG